MDMTKFDEFPAKVRAALDRFGHIDWLVLNAGVSQRARAMDSSIAVDEMLIRTNYLGPVALAKALLPSMVERKSGTVVAVSSLVGKFGTPLRSGYAGSKHALHGFFDSLRAEIWETGVRVTIVCPGFIGTSVSKNALAGDGSRYGVMDEATRKGMTAEEFAKRAIRAIAAGREEINIGGMELRGVFVKRFAPGLFSRMIRKAKVT